MPTGLLRVTGVRCTVNSVLLSEWDACQDGRRRFRDGVLAFSQDKKLREIFQDSPGFSVPT